MCGHRRGRMEGEDRARANEYAKVEARIDALLANETDFVAAMATVACELHQSFSHYHWTGFYRTLGSCGTLVIGPYQGTHGCLRIPKGKGVCGACALTKKTQLVPDVNEFPGHIACSSTTKSEIVVPLTNASGEIVAVLDVDSNDYDAFHADTDQASLERICSKLTTTRVWKTGLAVL